MCSVRPEKATVGAPGVARDMVPHKVAFRSHNVMSCLPDENSHFGGNVHGPDFVPTVFLGRAARRRNLLVVSFSAIFCNPIIRLN